MIDFSVGTLVFVYFPIFLLLVTGSWSEPKQCMFYEYADYIITREENPDIE